MNGIEYDCRIDIVYPALMDRKELRIGYMILIAITVTVINNGIIFVMNGSFTLGLAVCKSLKNDRGMVHEYP